MLNVQSCPKLSSLSLDAAVVVVNFDAKVDNEDDSGLLQEWHQRLRRPRINKDEASKQPCQDISSRAVAPPAGSGETKLVPFLEQSVVVFVVYFGIKVDHHHGRSSD